jgi:hypothetical protein
MIGWFPAFLAADWLIPVPLNYRLEDPRLFFQQFLFFPHADSLSPSIKNCVLWDKTFEEKLGRKFAINSSNDPLGALQIAELHCKKWFAIFPSPAGN